MRFYPTKLDSAFETPILFVHGAWHGAWCWEEHFVETFNSQGYDCYTFDLPLHDRPGKVPGINKLSMGDYLDSLVEHVATIPTPPIIIAHSMGGQVVQKYLEKHFCETVVLLSPAPPTGIITTALKFLTRSYAWWPILTLNLYKIMNTTDKLRWACFSDKLPNRVIKKYKDKICSESFLAFLNMLVPMVKINQDQYRDMLLIAGDKDNIFSVSENRRTAASYGAEFVVVNDMGHDLMLDAGWKKVATAITQWLGQRASCSESIGVDRELHAA